MDWILPSLSGAAVIKNLEYIWNWFCIISWIEKTWAMIALITFCIYPFIYKRKILGKAQQEEDKILLIKELKIALEEFKQAGKQENLDHGYHTKEKENKWEEIVKKFPQFQYFLTIYPPRSGYRYVDFYIVNYNKLFSLIIYLECGIDINKQVTFNFDE
ncbi:MAG: hypothetical protein K2Q34_01385 [Alphaproteobacteria bacterium]|nr:hypothetical protein [Alphaproteobacteria bacterium]